MLHFCTVSSRLPLAQTPRSEPQIEHLRLTRLKVAQLLSQPTTGMPQALDLLKGDGSAAAVAPPIHSTHRLPPHYSGPTILRPSLSSSFRLVINPSWLSFSVTHVLAFHQPSCHHHRHSHQSHYQLTRIPSSPLYCSLEPHLYRPFRNTLIISSCVLNQRRAPASDLVGQDVAISLPQASLFILPTYY
jgi:hypothetical protein